MSSPGQGPVDLISTEHVTMAPRFFAGPMEGKADPADLQFAFPSRDDVPKQYDPAQYTPANLDIVHSNASRLWPDITKQSCIEALQSQFANGDPGKAIVLLQFYRDAVEGYVTSVCKRNGSFLPLRGAVNFAGISCYLDSLLVAMFSRMENFEPLLYKKHYEDKPTERLAIWLRLFVNLLRNGERITIDIVEALLTTAVDAGWSEGYNPMSQQDAAEFFVFITEKLKMPLLALKVDIAHAGQEAEEDDHKLINEQLLYLPVPGTSQDPPILLEECLEVYFSNAVNVSRHLARPSAPTLEPARRRSYSIMSLASPSSHTSRRFTGPQALLAEDASSEAVSLSTPPPMPQAPDARSTELEFATDTFDKWSSVSHSSQHSGPQQCLDHPRLRSRYSDARSKPRRPSSHFDSEEPGSFDPLDDSSEARLPCSSDAVQGSDSPGPTTGSLPSYQQLFGFNDDGQAEARARDIKQSLWTSDNEIQLPAWMFLQLMPFYADNVGNSGEALENLEAEEVAHHFRKTRPVLGFCLKRYHVDEHGHLQRNNRAVIVPETISLPSFVADDSDQKQAFGKFKLLLEAAIFHRGNSVHSGHYCSLIAEDLARPRKTSTPSSSSQEWKRFSWLGTKPKKDKDDEVSDPPPPPPQPQLDSSGGRKWLFFDDMETSGERIKEVDCATAFDNEAAYLLFYRMVSLEDATTAPQSPVMSHTSAPSPGLQPNFPKNGSNYLHVPAQPNSKAASKQSLRAESRSSSRAQSPVFESPRDKEKEKEKEKDKDKDKDKDKKRKSGFFRRHHKPKDKDKDKDYASKYREEKCSVM